MADTACTMRGEAGSHLDRRRPFRLPLGPLRRSTGVPPMLRRSELRWRKLLIGRSSSSAA